MTQLSGRKKRLFALLHLAVFAAVAGGAGPSSLCHPKEDRGRRLDWFEDFRLSLTDRGLQLFAMNAPIKRIPTSAATGTWPSQLTHVAENVYVAEMNAAYQAQNLWPNPATGQYLFMRMLVNNSLPNGANTGGDHGFQTNAGNPLPWFWRVWGGDADSFTLEFSSWDESGTDEFQIDVPKDRVLRLEWRAQRNGTSAATLTVRVYNNETGVLLGEKTGITQTTAAGDGSNVFRQFLFGMSGQAPTSFNGGSVYWGAIAARVSDDGNDWIGPYPVAGVER
jgi:opacity protein-like surface antigen